MASFTDKSGKSWQVSLTVGHLSPLKQFNLDLGKAIRSHEGLAAIFEVDPADLVSGLYLICEDQIIRANLSPEQFAHLFDGPTVERAVEALIDAVMDFFPRQKIAQNLKGRLKKALQVMDQKATEQLDKDFEAKLNALTLKDFASN